MPISYNKLWKLLIDKKMKRIELMNAAGIGTSTLSKLGKDQYVSMEVLVKICKTLNCNIGDIVDIVRETEGQ
jgi:putative transcriptional regulator